MTGIFVALIVVYAAPLATAASPAPVSTPAAVPPLLAPPAGPDNIPLLIEELKDSDPEIAAAGKIRLVALGANAVPALISLLKTERNEEFKLRAGRALIEIGQPAVEPLIRSFATSDEQVRRYAWWAVVRIGRRSGDSAVMAPLARACNDPDDRIAILARRAYALFTETESPAPAPFPKEKVKVKRLIYRFGRPNYEKVQTLPEDIRPTDVPI